MTFFDLRLRFQEISQQLMLERRAKKKNMNSYNKTADVENKKGDFNTDYLHMKLKHRSKKSYFIWMASIPCN